MRIDELPALSREALHAGRPVARVERGRDRLSLGVVKEGHRGVGDPHVIDQKEEDVRLGGSGGKGREQPGGKDMVENIHARETDHGHPVFQQVGAGFVRLSDCGDDSPLLGVRGGVRGAGGGGPFVACKANRTA